VGGIPQHVAIVNDAQVIIKNLAKIIAPVLVLSLFPVVNGSVANAANAPSITIGSKKLVNDLPFVDPIYVGYKGPTSFIPAAVANKKDKFGCVLRQRMIIDLATKKPKVSKGCRMSGGVWTTALGAKITKSADVIITPVMSYKDAWGQGAFAWTPEQRLAWATNTKVSTSKTRAKAVTNLQVTQNIVSKAESANIRRLTQDNEAYEALRQQFPEMIRSEIEMLCGGWSFACALFLSALYGSVGASLGKQFTDNAAKVAEERCSLMIHLASNITAWGLSVSPQTLAIMREVSTECVDIAVGITLESKLNGINPVDPTTPVPTVSVWDGRSPLDRRVFQILSDYPDASSGVPVPSGAFGVHAPVDWGTPGVGASWIRLWDAGVSWAQMEPSQGKIDFTKLRASIDSAERSGARVLYVLGDTPGWANGGKPGSTAPTSNDSALNFIRALKAEFGSRIGAYEVWNEGNLPTYWTGSQEQLAALTKGMKDVIGDTSMVFAASTTTRATNAFVTNYGDYLDELRALNWPVDGFTVHSYPTASAGPVERVNELGQFKTMLALRGAPVKPIWDTELNYGLAGLGEGVRRIDDATGAAYIAQSYIQSIQYGIDTTFWYLWTGTRGYYDLLGVQLDPSTPISNGVWNNLRALLEGTRMTRCVESGNIFMCQFVDRLGEPFTLMWTREGTSVVNVKGLGSSVCGLEVADSHFNRACSVVRGDTITIGMLPVQVTNRLN
jgi:hypothetical protein